MKLGEIKRDEKLMELRPVNQVTVSRYRQAMRQGAEFPPLKYDTVHNIVIGGNHRIEAMLAEYGQDHEPSMEYMQCKTWADVLEEFARDNAKHGMPLEGFHRRCTALALMEAGKTTEEVAQLFDVSTRRVEQWGDKVVVLKGKKSQSVPVKHGAPPEPTPITRKEYNQHREADKGVTVKHLAAQITAYARRGWLQLNDDRERAALEELRTTLNNALE